MVALCCEIQEMGIFMQLQGIVFIQLQGNDIVVNFQGNIFIQIYVERQQEKAVLKNVRETRNH